MQFPESWLREFCDPPISTAELSELLTMAGMEVEETRPVAPPFSGVPKKCRSKNSWHWHKWLDGLLHSA